VNPTGQQRIEFHVAVLAYRFLNGTAPYYLADGLQRIADISSRWSAAICVDGTIARSSVESH
jgi:hypothetical protein